MKWANQLDGLREQVLGVAHCIEITFGQSRFCWDQRWGSFSHLGSFLLQPPEDDSRTPQPTPARS